MASRQRQVRREEGDVRNAAWRALTTEAKIASLDRRLGVDKGATRQRRKLRIDPK